MRNALGKKTMSVRKHFIPRLARRGRVPIGPFCAGKTSTFTSSGSQSATKKIEKVSSKGAIKASSVSTDMNTATSTAPSDTTATAARRSRRKPTGKGSEPPVESPDGDWKPSRRERQRLRKSAEASSPITQQVTQLMTFTYNLTKGDGSIETFSISLPASGTQSITHRGLCVAKTPLVLIPLIDGTTMPACAHWVKYVFRAPFDKTPRTKPACSKVDGKGTSCKHPKVNLCWFHLAGRCAKEGCTLIHMDLDRSPVTKTIVTPASSAGAKPVVKQVTVRAKPSGKKMMCFQECLTPGSCTSARCPNAHTPDQLLTEQYRRDFSNSLTSPDTLFKCYIEINKLFTSHPLLVGYKQNGCPFSGRLGFLFETTTVDELRKGFPTHRFAHMLEMWYRMAIFFRSGHYTKKHGKADAAVGLGIDNVGMDCTLWELARRASIPCSKAVMLSIVDGLVENPTKALRKKYVCTGGFFCSSGFHPDSFIDVSALSGSSCAIEDIGALPTKLSSALNAFNNAQEQLTLKHQVVAASKTIDQDDDEWVDISAKKASISSKKSTHKSIKAAEDVFKAAGDGVYKVVSAVMSAIINNPSQFFPEIKCAVKDYKQTPLVSAVKATTQIAKAVSRKDIKDQRADKKASRAASKAVRKEKKQNDIAVSNAKAASELRAYQQSLDPATVITRASRKYDVAKRDLSSSLKRFTEKLEQATIESEKVKYQKRVDTCTTQLADLDEENTTLISLVTAVRNLMKQLETAKAKAQRDVSRIVYGELADTLSTTPEKLANDIEGNFKRLTVMKKQGLGLSDEEELHLALHTDYHVRLSKMTSVIQLQEQLDAAVLELHKLE